MVKQPFVIRFYYPTESEAIGAHAQLESMGLFGDYVKATGSGERAAWKVVFAESNPTAIKVAHKRLQPKPKFAEIFDPAAEWTEGFKPLSY